MIADDCHNYVLCYLSYYYVRLSYCFFLCVTTVQHVIAMHMHSMARLTAWEIYCRPATNIDIRIRRLTNSCMCMFVYCAKYGKQPL